MKATTYDFALIGNRMREARRQLRLNQTVFYDKYVGHEHMTLRTFQRAESGANEAGISLVSAFVEAGINANWLLTGDGPMLLADLAPKPAPAPQINVDALVQAFCVTFQTAPKGETVEQSARKALAFYEYCQNQGLITPEGEGKGNLESAV